MAVSNNHNTQSTSNTSINNGIRGASSDPQQPLNLKIGSSDPAVITPVQTNTNASPTTAGATQVTKPDITNKYRNPLAKYLLNITSELIQKQKVPIETNISELESKKTQLTLKQQQEALVPHSNSTTPSAMSSQSVDEESIKQFLSTPNLAKLISSEATVTSSIKAIDTISKALSRFLFVTDEDYKEAQDQYNKAQQPHLKKTPQKGKGKGAQSTTAQTFFQKKMIF